MTPATPITEALETLMPEPAMRLDYAGHFMHKKGPLGIGERGLYDADQMREMYRAATERAAAICENERIDEIIESDHAYNAATDACAAAIRASSGKGE
jgi:hypothetical protein